MSDITVKNGQGITPSTSNNIGKTSANGTKPQASVWLEQNNSKRIKSDSQTQNNVQNDDSIMGKIKQLLTGKAPEVQAAQNAAPVNAADAPSASSPAGKTETVESGTPTSASSASEANIVANTPLEGSVETGRAANALMNKMSLAEDVKISVVSDEVSALMNKKDRTPEETQTMHTELNNGMKKLGNSMTKFVAAEYGDGSETISPEAFAKFQKAGRDELSAQVGIKFSPEELQQQAESDKILFNKIDINGDGKIDNKEMSAFYYAMDFDENNRSNGAIDTVSMGANAALLDDPNQNMFDKKMAYTYKTLWGGEGA